MCPCMVGSQIRCGLQVKEYGPQNQLQRTRGSSERLKQQSWSLHGSALGPLRVLRLLACCFYGTLNNGSGVSLTLLPAFEPLFLLLGCPV